MKLFRLLIAAFVLFASALSGQTDNAGIGTLTPDASAVLDVSATDKGFLLPRMTTAQRLAIPSPASSLLVFDTDSASFWYYSGAAWRKLLSAPAVVPSAVIFSLLNQSGIAGTAETIIGSYVIPANTLQLTGESIEIHAFGELTTDTSTIRFKVGANVAVFPVTKAGDWSAVLNVYRKSAGELKIAGVLSVNGIPITDVVVGNQDFTAAMPFQITGAQTQAVINGVSLEGFVIMRIR